MNYYDEFNNKSYKIFINKNKEMTKYFKEYIKNKNTKFIGVDLEFNSVSKTKKDVALIQINLEINDNNNIYIFDPNTLDTKQIKTFIKLLTTKDITIIMHGIESLDMPYLFDQLFNKDKKLIYKFLKNFYDTKYLCEYKHILENKVEKCSIYELYLEMNVISKKQYNYLLEMSKVFDINEIININNLKPKFIEYAYYDVIYLISLFNKFNKNIINQIGNITRLCFYHKKVNDDNYNNLKLLITQCNNYFIINNNKNIKLNDIYNDNIYNEYKNHNLLQINYFKSFLELLYKYNIYKILFKKYKIYQKKDEIINKFEINIKLKKIIIFFFKL